MYRMRLEDKESLKNKKFTESLLFACLAACKPVINRYAYSEKKWANYDLDYVGNLGGSYRASRLEWMEYRKKIQSLLLSRYPMKIIIQKTKSFLKNNENEKATQKAVKEIVALIDSGDYQLL